MPQRTLFETITKLTNEKVATLAAFSIYKVVPATKLTDRLLDSAFWFIHHVQYTYYHCFECDQLVIRKSINPFIHDKCAEALREEDAYWKNFEKEMEQERKDQEALERQQKADDDAWSIFESDQAVLERHAQKAAEEEEEEQEELDTPTYDEENFFPAETDDVTVTPVKKEN